MKVSGVALGACATPKCQAAVAVAVPLKNKQIGVDCVGVGGRHAVRARINFEVDFKQLADNGPAATIRTI